MSEPAEVKTSGGTPLALGAALITVLAILVGVLGATGDEGEQVATGSSGEPAGVTTTTADPATADERSSGLIPMSDHPPAVPAAGSTRTTRER